MFLHEFGCNAYDVLALPVFHHVERLQCTDNVILGNACHLTEKIKNSKRNDLFLQADSRKVHNGNC